jgi:hypothetical protein
MTTPRHDGTALITGASSGIGATYADRLARHGHDLILVTRSEERLGGLAARVAAQTGRKVEVLVADITAKKDLIALEQRLATDAAIRVLVNHDGAEAGYAPAAPAPDQREITIQLNAVASTRLSRAAAPAFVARGGGTIVNIASPRASRDGCKTHVVRISEALEREFGPHGLRVQPVLPDTPDAMHPL